MITHLCDRCGRPIERGELRYVARVEVFAAPDVLEITLADLLADSRDEMDRLLRQCEQMTEDELMRDVHVELKFDLCRRCQRAYLNNPLAGR
jgi:NMD protein affecting ribosome stability and mRNA decay